MPASGQRVDGSKRDKVIRFLAANPRRAYRPTEIATATGLSSHQAGTACYEMTADPAWTDLIEKRAREPKTPGARPHAVYKITRKGSVTVRSWGKNA